MAPKPNFRTEIQNPPGKDIVWPTTTPDDHRNPEVFRDAMRVRETVFCDEQHCSLENELDEDDSKSWHWVVYSEGKDSRPVGVIRLVPPPHPPHPAGNSDRGDEKPYVKITRLAVLSEYRKHGVGRLLVGTALDWAAHNASEVGNGWGGLVLIHAQVAVEKVWERMGFVTDPSLGQWEEEGIMHLGMWRTIELHA